jgi:outer membrane PBP1 activator LpoA protein
MHGFFIVGQTISFPISVFNNTYFTKLAQLAKIISVFLVLLLLLTSCSSQTPQKKASKEVIIAKDAPVETLTAEQTIALAQELMAEEIVTENINRGATESLANDNINQSIVKLINANHLYLQEKNYTKAIWLAEQLLRLNSTPLFTHKANVEVENGNENTRKIESIEYTNLLHARSMQLMLIKAQSYQALNYTELTEQTLAAITSLAQQHNLTLNVDYYQLKSKLFQAKNKVIDSLQASLYAFSLNTEQNEEAIEEAKLLLWQKIKVLSPWQVDILTKRTAPYLAGWLQLNQYANKFGNNATQLLHYITQWQRQYPNHPAKSIALQLVQQNLAQQTIENIAVILPLTGKQKNAGLAVQQGILAAFEQENAQLSESETIKTLHFIDSNTVDWHTLPTQFNEQKIDFVIGPLLKSHLNKYLKLSQPSAVKNPQEPSSETDNSLLTEKNIVNESAFTLPTLLLNLSSQDIVSPNHVAFSMRPEDEAIQAAATLSQVGFKQAIVLSHQDKVSQRIALAFVKKWQEQTAQSLEIVYFEQGKAMQANLKASLDVNVSQNRIDELQSRLKQTIKAQTRNRRDVDMVYVVGSAEQTRLVKPYIDVNISPFSKRIPIYASSRSHSIKSDASSASDLQGLTFTEIPWLLKSANQNVDLAQLSAQLWPKRHDSLLRIFAMGFDSYNLINKLSLMQQAPYIRHFGQTGVLQLNDNTLTRSLIWGRYQRQGVSQITFD